MKQLHFRRLPLAVCALSGAIALASCTPIKTDNAASPDANVVDGNSVIPNAANAVDENATSENGASANTVADEGATPAPSKAQFSYLETVMVPGQGDLLHLHKVSRMAIDSQLKSGGDAAPALQEIIEKAPAYYPSGAKINSAKDDGKAMVIDLNTAFDTPEFWSSRGEKTTELAVYALVNSLDQKSEGTPRAVKFTIEKKPAVSLGEFDIEGTIKPQTRLVAK